MKLTLIWMQRYGDIVYNLPSGTLRVHEGQGVRLNEGEAIFPSLDEMEEARTENRSRMITRARGKPKS